MSAVRHDPLTVAEAARIMREAVKDKSYQPAASCPMGSSRSQRPVTCMQTGTLISLQRRWLTC